MGAVNGTGFRVPGSGFRVLSSEFRVLGRNGNGFVGATLVVARQAGRHKTGPTKREVPARVLDISVARTIEQRDNLEP